jgi:hypothetical protein
MHVNVIGSHVSPVSHSLSDWHSAVYVQNPLSHVSPVSHSFAVLHCMQSPVFVLQ